MNDESLHDLLRRAARARERMDFTRAGLALETRVLQHLTEAPRAFGAAERLGMWWRAAVAAAAAVGIAAFFILAGTEAFETEEKLIAWWDAGAPSWTDTLFN